VNMRINAKHARTAADATRSRRTVEKDAFG